MTKEHSICGVKGILGNIDIAPSGRIRSQKWRSELRKIPGDTERMRVNIRFDDHCNNGQPDFAITCDIYDTSGRNVGGGAAHELIAKAFPELAHLVKWHLCGTDGPMHYIANTVFHASIRDHEGLLAGERKHVHDISGQPMWRMVAVDKDGNEKDTRSLGDIVKSASRPECNLTLEYRPVWREGVGKDRNFEAARSCACWPEATYRDLMWTTLDEKERLIITLKKRLPGLVAEFKKAVVEECGFVWEGVGHDRS